TRTECRPRAVHHSTRTARHITTGQTLPEAALDRRAARACGIDPGGRVRTGPDGDRHTETVERAGGALGRVAEAVRG
ncbi:hypothetical protein, partial [Streptomyces mirabilis]